MDTTMLQRRVLASAAYALCLSATVADAQSSQRQPYAIETGDPTKPSEALSEVERNGANEWVQHTLFTRLNDKRNGRILMVMQRLHEDDVIGNVVEKRVGGFRSLSFAAIAPCDEIHVFRTAFGITRHVRKEGEALHPAREPLDVLHEQRRLRRPRANIALRRPQQVRRTLGGCRLRVRLRGR